MKTNTLIDLAAATLANHRDRAALARRGTASRPAALLVILIGPKAIAEISPVLMAAALSIKHDPGIAFTLRPDQPITHAFDWMTAQGLEHAALQFEIRTKDGRGETNCIAVALLGSELCRSLVPLLNARQCPTPIL